jgi:polyisoprenoid-binding protein YceI
MKPGQAPEAIYSIDAKTSQFTVQAFASGLISSVAHSPKIAIRDWTAEIKFVPGTLANASLRATVKASSLDVLDEMRESDRRELHRIMEKEVLESARFPEIVFESSQIRMDRLRDDLYKASVEGLLSLHGVQQRHTFMAQVALGVDSFRTHGEFLVRQTDYNMHIANIAGGTLKLQDELKFSFYVVARKQN